MPQVTDAQRHKLNRDPIRDPMLILLSFQEDKTDDVHRAAINNEDITRNGDVYSQANIGFQLPNSSSQELSIKLSMSNVSRLIGTKLNRARSMIGCNIVFVDASDLDGVPMIDTKNLLVISAAQGNTTKVSVTLGPRVSLHEPVPGKTTSKQLYPGVHFSA